MSYLSLPLKAPAGAHGHNFWPSTEARNVTHGQYSRAGLPLHRKSRGDEVHILVILSVLRVKERGVGVRALSTFEGRRRWYWERSNHCI